MVGNFLAGGAAVNRWRAAPASPLTVVDVGVAGDLTALPQPPERRARFVAAKVRAGTANLRAPGRHDAATRPPPRSPSAASWRAPPPPPAAELLCAGEMGIGNSTAAAALLCALAGVAPVDAVGRGTGLDDAHDARTRSSVIAAALARHRRRGPPRGDPLGALAAVGGLELAAMAGLMLGGAAAARPGRRRRLHRRRRRARRRAR